MSAPPATAKDSLMRAVQCDQAGRLLEAQSLYQDGTQILLKMVEGDNLNEHNKRMIHERVKEYIARAEQIQERVEKQFVGGDVVDTIIIEENSTGHSYQSLYGKYLNSQVKELLLHESYLQKKHQFHNFIAFLELVVKNCRELKYVRLVTKTNKDAPDQQKNWLDQIHSDLQKRNIRLDIQYDEDLHDRKIVLSNGYIIKSGRGLDIYKPTNPFFSLGLVDYDFRQCSKTEIDISRTKNLSN